VSVPDLAEFLLARIAEDEATVTTALADPTRWDAGDWIDRAWSPVRVLAECEAKREIVRAYQLRAEQGSGRGGEVIGYHATGVAVAIRHLAAVYADHPDYRDEWRA
jgi:hypothetical protein